MAAAIAMAATSTAFTPVPRTSLSTRLPKPYAGLIPARLRMVLRQDGKDLLTISLDSFAAENTGQAAPVGKKKKRAGATRAPARHFTQ